ncbi:MAG: GNAT family N-acetyltransferase [Lachnotalea sp.]
MLKKIIETERLYLREMNTKDYKSLCKILQDKETMYAYEHAFSDKEAKEWMDKQLISYSENGFGLWALVLKDTEEMIGQCGITIQPCNDKQVHEVGYLLQKDYWKKGYATEAAIACKEYAFNTLGINEIYSIIRDNNIASQNVARRNGMQVSGRLMKHYNNKDILHLLFMVKSGMMQKQNKVD